MWQERGSALERCSRWNQSPVQSQQQLNQPLRSLVLGWVRPTSEEKPLGLKSASASLSLALIGGPTLDLETHKQVCHHRVTLPAHIKSPFLE